MSEDSLNLVLQKQSNKTSSDIAKIQIKSEKHSSFGGIFPIMEKFDRMLSHTIDSALGLRSKVHGYQYSEIIRSLMRIFLWRVMYRRREASNLRGLLRIDSSYIMG
jgi:hypothetical protein